MPKTKRTCANCAEADCDWQGTNRGRHLCWTEISVPVAELEELIATWEKNTKDLPAQRFYQTVECVVELQQLIAKHKEGSK